MRKILSYQTVMIIFVLFSMASVPGKSFADSTAAACQGVTATLDQHVEAGRAYIQSNAGWWWFPPTNTYYATGSNQSLGVNGSFSFTLYPNGDNYWQMVDPGNCEQGDSCPSVSSTNSEHEAADRAYTQTAAGWWWFPGVTTWYANGSDDAMGTIANQVTVLYIGADGGYYTDDPMNCSIASTYVVTSVSLENGAITPEESQEVDSGDVLSFEITPDEGFAIDTVEGCNGTLDGFVYTTAEITEDCTVTASFEPNEAPVVNAGDDLNAPSDELIVLDGSATDANGDDLTYVWSVSQTNGLTVELHDEDQVQAGFVVSGVPVMSSGEVSFILTVTDPYGLSSSDEVVFTIDGSGLALNPIKICTYEDLMQIGVTISKPPHAAYKQICDIDASLSREQSYPLLQVMIENSSEEILAEMGDDPVFKGFLPIGLNMYYTSHPTDPEKNMYDYWLETEVLDSNYPVYFKGSYDGQYTTITNLFMEGTNAGFTGVGLGLFFNSTGTIQRINLINVDIYNYYNVVGGISGMTFGQDPEDSLIKDCYVSGKLDSWAGIDGGIIGLANGGTVDHVVVESDIGLRGDENNSFVGGITGFSGPSTVIKNSHFIGNVRGNFVSGGIAGMGSEIYDCSSHGTITGNSQIGGILGSHVGFPLARNWSDMTVSGVALVGGIAGHAHIIDDSFFTGTVEGEAAVGGLVGYSTGKISEENGIYNSFAAGQVTLLPQNLLPEDSYLPQVAGGLVGFAGQLSNNSADHEEYAPEEAASNSFYDMQATGQSTSSGGAGLNTVEMQNQTTYIDAGWDLETVWIHQQGEYPGLLNNQLILFQAGIRPINQ